MAVEADKPEETALPAPVLADVPVEAPVAEGADAQTAPVAEAGVPAAAPKAKRIPAAETVPAPEPVAVTVEELPAPVAKAKKALPASPAPKATKVEPVAKAPAADPKPARAKGRVAKPKAAKPVRTPVVKPAKQTQKSKTATSSNVIPTIKHAAIKSASPQSKEPFTMTKIAPTDFIASFQNVFGEFQTKAATAYEKSTAVLGEANDFAKGNVEAVVESGKILASGLQDLGATFVADSRSAFDTLTAEVKDLAAVKTPAEFFSLQSSLARKNFDTAVAQFSKSTEAVLKLANDAISPISGRVTLAVEKVGKAA